MTRNEAIELLEQYKEFLSKDKDTIIVALDGSIDRFMDTKWAKENMSLCTHKGFITSQKTPKGTAYFCSRCGGCVSFLEFMLDQNKFAKGIEKSS